MVNCSTVGSDNDFRKNSNFSYFQLAKEEQRKKAWLHKIGRDKKKLPKGCNICVCHVHLQSNASSGT